MSKILDTTVDEVTIGSKIPMQDRLDKHSKTYYLTIEDKTQVFVCENCGHKVGKDYVDELPFCLDCLLEYEEKTHVKFTGDLQ